jgi:hypothetical protein
MSAFIWNPWLGARIAPAWQAALDILADGEPHDWTDLIPAMVAAGPIMAKTAVNALNNAAVAGAISRDGSYGRVTRIHRGRLSRLLPTADAHLIVRPETAK